MTARLRLPGVLLAVLALLASAGPALAGHDAEHSAYAEAGGQLDACAFTRADLEAALTGIPAEIESVVPELREAIRHGIDTHEVGDCAGREPETPASPDDPVSSAVPPVTTTPAAPATTAPATPATPATGGGTAPAQPGAEPAASPAESAPAAAQDRDRTPLVVALIALGGLLLLALAIWGWGRMRGWDPAWAGRARHAWGEAGFRATSTWSEFADWLRLGR